MVFSESLVKRRVWKEISQCTYLSTSLITADMFSRMPKQVTTTSNTIWAIYKIKDIH